MQLFGFNKTETLLQKFLKIFWQFFSLTSESTHEPQYRSTQCRKSVLHLFQKGRETKTIWLSLITRSGSNWSLPKNTQASKQRFTMNKYVSKKLTANSGDGSEDVVNSPLGVTAAALNEEEHPEVAVGQHSRANRRPDTFVYYLVMLIISTSD